MGRRSQKLASSSAAGAIVSSVPAKTRTASSRGPTGSRPCRCRHTPTPVTRAVTGLVTGVGVWRQRQGREPVGARLLAVLVFAGTLLTIAPAAELLASL